MMAIEGFVRDAEKLGVHSFMVLRGGETVAEGYWHPYRQDVPQSLYSLSKSFTSTAVGLAVHDGLLTVDDLVHEILGGADDLKGMRVRHLLTMTTGHDTESGESMAADPDEDWVRGFLSHPVVHEPGTRFVYNSGATYALSAILQRLTGVTLLDYLRPRLFEPLGFGPAAWETCPRGITVGGWGLTLRTRDLATFGQLYLRRGRWQGEQLVPAEWVDEATRLQVPNVDPTGSRESLDWQQGYGYKFWRCRHDGYRADGAFGQFIVVLPRLDTVVAVTAATEDMQAVLDAVWAHLLGPLEPSQVVGLELPAVTGTAEPREDLPGRFHTADPPVPPRRHHRPDIDQPSRIVGFAIVRAPHGWTVRLHDEHGAHEFACAPGRWVPSTMTTCDGVANPIATTGGWRGPTTFELCVCHTGDPCTRTYTAEFDDSGVTVTPVDSVGFEFTTHPVIRAWAVRGGAVRADVVRG
ncbi:serine hydrolase [Dactylosporangium sp. NPDC005555]|uniref:serine hydrolase domain-containing protein n=1 Tax=Dactylosporangium sp. NPDC005555 TaxID=3154889 RepID=UPI0033B0E637